MNSSRRSSKIFVTIIVVTSIVIIGLLINSSKANLNNAVIDVSKREINQIGSQIKTSLEATLEGNVSVLTKMADNIVTQQVKEDEILNFIDNQSQIMDYENIYYIDLKGSGISSNNDPRDFSNNQSFNNVLNNHEFTTIPRIEEDVIILELFVPVIKNNEVMGVLYNEVPNVGCLNPLEHYTDGSGDFFIVDYDLNLIYSTSENHSSTFVIPQGDVDEMGIENVQKAESDFKQGNSGSFYYDYYGTPKVIAYLPVEMTNWSIAMNVEVEHLNSILMAAADNFNTVSRFIYWIIIAVVIYMSVAQVRANNKLFKSAYYDSLTGLPNLLKMKEEIWAILSRNKHKQFSIVVFDVVNFKAINEMFGYEVGDRVLKGMKSFGESFKEPSMIMARITQDKFAIFAGNGFLDDTNRLLNTVDTHFDDLVPELINYTGTFKIGRYNIEPGENDVDDIIAKVTLAHARAKTIKGELLCDYDDSFKQRLINEAEITNKMKAALDNQEFNTYLQPKFSTYDNKLVGAEALVRWIEADGNVIYPGDFIPLFERNGFIVDVDKFMFENVCKTMRTWLDKGLDIIPISINCSRINLNNPYLVDGMVAIADKYNIPHNFIEIELTESVTMDDESTIEELFVMLHNNGFRISIDDFGSGYSSLGMLKNLKVDTLKMDRSFFVDVKNARRDDMLIDSIVKMSHNLGMYVVAEGIETPEQIEILRSMNCDAIQGYVHARPMTISEFESKFSSMMMNKSAQTKDYVPLIQNINDIKYASTFAPCGLLITEIDEYFTIVEANDYYFKMIEYTREEVRDLFKNKALNNMNEEYRQEFINFFNEKIEKDPTGDIEFTNKFVVKSGIEHTFLLNGRIAINEFGEKRLYLSVTDISKYAKKHE